MDFYEQASNLVKLYYESKENKEKNFELINKVCKYFDEVKDETLNQDHLQFLYNMCNQIGIPQYYDMLVKYRKLKYKKDTNLFNIPFSVLINFLQESSLHVDENNKLHKYQKNVIDLFTTEDRCRYLLTAPTSFGKTYIVPEIIKAKKYSNVVLLFPTLALLAENHAKFISDKNLISYFSEYKIHTLSDYEPSKNNKNIWIYTPERFLSMLDRHSEQDFDFVFMDEMYKIDNQYIIDVESIGENQRDIAFRIALHHVCEKSKDILLSGPFIELSLNDAGSLNIFLKKNNFKIINYNKIEVVNKEYLEIKEVDKGNFVCDNISFVLPQKNKKEKLKNIVNGFSDKHFNSIIYCGTKVDAERYAEFLTKNREPINQELCQNKNLKIFINHLEQRFNPDWIVVKALKMGIGIHHGLVPKYIQKEIINFFNENIIDCLTVTTTITEGINTNAKNVIITSSKKGKKNLKKFDAQNIAGRAGRFFQHYKGNVICLDDNFKQILDENSQELRHLNFDIDLPKKDVDIDITSSEYLSKKEQQRKEEIDGMAKLSQIPLSILNQFKSISKIDKINLFNDINSFSENDWNNFECFTQKISYNKIDFDAMNTFCKTIYKYIPDDERDFKYLIKTETKSNNQLLTAKLHYFLENGFFGVFDNEIIYATKNVNTALRNTANLIFNTFRYNLCKYLGVFDLLYRYHLSLRGNKNFDEIVGLTKLIQRLEHGALTKEGQILNDYGVPFKVIDYYDRNKREDIKQTFDTYELNVLDKVKNLVEE